jgi:hypothetical protein
MKNHQWTLMGTNSRQGRNAKRFVIPSEVEAATQPRTISGRGQAFHPAELPFAIATGSFDFASLRSG